MLPPPNGRDSVDGEAMDEELTETEMKTLVSKLEALRQELTEGLTAQEQISAPVDLETPIGRLSRMDAIQQQKMAEANAGKLRVRLKQVEQALQNAAAGTYGDCRKCDEPIAKKRLMARPETPFCLDCQGEKER